ncbi:hypothetical protein SPRG_17421, partial [Saprolegnia parasitica CBS 223.65]
MGKPPPRCSACNAEARVRGPKALRACGVCKRCYDERAKAKAAEAKAAAPLPLSLTLPKGALELRFHKSYAYAHNSVRPVTCAITLAL